MHRTVIERIGVYHYRSDCFFLSLSVATAHRQLSVAHSGKLHGDLERTDLPAGEEFSGNGEKGVAILFSRGTRNDDFRARRGSLRGPVRRYDR